MGKGFLIGFVGSENNQVKVYQQKISKWQEKVAERLQVLGQRTGIFFYSFFKESYYKI